jgi:hypothetical protein
MAVELSGLESALYPKTSSGEQNLLTNSADAKEEKQVE